MCGIKTKCKCNGLRRKLLKLSQLPDSSVNRRKWGMSGFHVELSASCVRCVHQVRMHPMRYISFSIKSNRLKQATDTINVMVVIGLIIICSYIRSIEYAFAYRYLVCQQNSKTTSAIESSRLSRLRFVRLFILHRRRRRSQREFIRSQHTYASQLIKYSCREHTQSNTLHSWITDRL